MAAVPGHGHPIGALYRWHSLNHDNQSFLYICIESFTPLCRSLSHCTEFLCHIYIMFIKPGARQPSAPGFLKLLSCGRRYVYVCVCVRPPKPFM